MKKLIVLLTITCMAIGSNAQHYLGIKGGAGMSALMPGYTYTHLFGISGVYGLAYKRQITERVMLEGDVLLDSRVTLVDMGLEDYTLVAATYISVPLTVHWMTPFKKRELVPYRTGQPNVYWFAEGGLAPMYALSAETYQDPSTIPLELDPEDIKAKSFDLAFVGGLGLNFGFKNSGSRLVLGTRAYYGLLNFNNYEGAPVMKNFAFGGFLEWDFSLSKKKYYQYRW